MNTHNQSTGASDKPNLKIIQQAPDGTADAASILERVLAHGESEEPTTSGTLSEAVVSTWTNTVGMLSNGSPARLSASCLLRPEPGDRAMIWTGGDGQCWVMGILERVNRTAPAVVTVPGPLAIEAPRVGISANTVHIAAEDFLTSTRNRHAVEETRTETARVRVAQIGTDIRRVTTADDTISGTFLQRAGTWISSTTREARLRARTFLFD